MNKVFVIIIFLLGAIAGWGLSWLFNSGEPAEASVASADDWAQNPDDSNALLARIREQEQEIVQLRSALSDATPLVAGEIPDFGPEEEATEPDTAPRQGFMRRMEERMERRLDGWVTDYRLDASQRSRLEEIFRAQMENMRARRNGEDVEPYNLDEAIAGVLNPQQFSQYLEESQQEIYDRAEMIATTQLVRLIQSTDLTDDQQAMVYDTINTAAQEWLIARQTGEDYDMRQAVQDQLGTVLSGEQLSTYLDGLNRGPGFGPPGGGPPPP